MDVIYLPKPVLIRRVKELFLLSLITLTVAIFLILLIERVFPSEFESVKTIEANEKPKLIRGGDGKAKEIGGFKKTITDNKVRIQNRVNQNLKKVRNASPRVVVVAI